MTSSMQMSSPPSEGQSARRKLLKNAFWLYSLQGLNYLLPMAVLPYLIRTLGMDGYGTIALAQSFAQYFVVATDYGFNLSATKKAVLIRDREEELSRLFWAVFFIKMSLLVCGAFVLLLVLHFSRAMHAMQSAFMIGYLAVVGNVLFPIWYFQGTENMRAISMITGLAKLVTTGIIFILIRKNTDTNLALLLLSLAPFLAGLLGFGKVVRDPRIGFQWPLRSDILSALRDGWHLFVSNAAITLYTNTNVFLVGLIAGPSQAGYFSAAEKIIRAAQGLLAPITQAIFPHISTLMQRSAEQAIRFIRKSLVGIAAPMFAGSLLILVLSPQLSSIVFGFQNSYTVSTLRWISFLPFFVAVSNILGVQTMVVFGHEKAFSRILIMAGVLNVALASSLIRIMKAPGAGAAVFMSEAFVAIAMFWYLRKVGLYILSKGLNA